MVDHVKNDKVKIKINCFKNKRLKLRSLMIKIKLNFDYENISVRFIFYLLKKDICSEVNFYIIVVKGRVF